MSTVAVILAYDPGDGFVGPKYASTLDGKHLLNSVIDDAAAWPVDETVVVLGHAAGEVLESLDSTFGDRVTFVIDEGWSEGEASPLRAALDLISRDRSVTECVVARGDQPGIRAQDVAALIEALHGSDAIAAVPKYRYAVGWPIALDHHAWDLFLGLEGAIDVRDILASHGASVSEVWIDKLEPLRYRTPDDFTRPRR